MKYEMSSDAKQRADKCSYDYVCLAGEGDCLCNVNKSIDDKIVLIDPPFNFSCGYLMPFGNSYICNCPVRTELYKKHRV